jgi:hypothetical protein
MHGSAFRNFDLGPIICWAIVGMVLTGLAALAGLGWLIWFIINHVQIV